MVFKHLTISAYTSKQVCHVRVSLTSVPGTPVHDGWLKPHVQSTMAAQCLHVAAVLAEWFHGEADLSPWGCGRPSP
jgi:hypothetical protein